MRFIFLPLVITALKAEQNKGSMAWMGGNDYCLCSNAFNLRKKIAFLKNGPGYEASWSCSGTRVHLGHVCFHVFATVVCEHVGLAATPYHQVSSPDSEDSEESSQGFLFFCLHLVWDVTEQKSQTVWVYSEFSWNTAPVALGNVPFIPANECQDV